MVFASETGFFVVFFKAIFAESGEMSYFCCHDEKIFAVVIRGSVVYGDDGTACSTTVM